MALVMMMDMIRRGRIKRRNLYNIFVFLTLLIKYLTLTIPAWTAKESLTPYLKAHAVKSEIRKIGRTEGSYVSISIEDSPRGVKDI